MKNPSGIFIRLCAMFLLGYMSYGAWYATLGLVLQQKGFGTVIGTAFSLGAIAGIFSPMFLGAIADRFFASQRVLAVLHLCSAAIMFTMPWVASQGNTTLILVAIFVYMLFFMPTLGLMASIALIHVGKHENLFPYVRLFGPLGWAVAGLAVGAMGLSASTGVFIVSAILSVVLGVYSFTLPSTPAPARGAKFSWGDVIGSKAFYLFRNRNFLAVSIAALLTTIPIAMYNSYGSTYLSALGVKNVSGLLSIGALSEIVFIGTIPFVLAKFGTKWAFVAGLVTWAIRFVLFIAASGGSISFAVIAIALHGVCNDFILVVGSMYMNKVAAPQVRAQTQSMFMVLTGGIGTFLGSIISGEIYNRIVAPQGVDDLGAWSQLWVVGVAVSVVAAIVFIIMFRREPKGHEEIDVPAAEETTPAAV